MIDWHPYDDIRMTHPALDADSRERMRDTRAALDRRNCGPVTRPGVRPVTGNDHAPIPPKPRSPMARDFDRPCSARHRANWATLVEIGSVVVATMADRSAMYDHAQKHRAKVRSEIREGGGWAVVLVRAPEFDA